MLIRTDHQRNSKVWPLIVLSGTGHNHYVFLFVHLISWKAILKCFWNSSKFCEVFFWFVWFIYRVRVIDYKKDIRWLTAICEIQQDNKVEVGKKVKWKSKPRRHKIDPGMRLNINFIIWCWCYHLIFVCCLYNCSEGKSYVFSNYAVRLYFKCSSFLELG